MDNDKRKEQNNKSQNIITDRRKRAGLKKASCSVWVIDGKEDEAKTKMKKSVEDLGHEADSLYATLLMKDKRKND